MDLTQIIVTALGIIFAGGVSSFFTLKFTKQKAQADAMASVQDVYQETITDLRTDKSLLKEERNGAIEERNKAIADFNAAVSDIAMLKKDVESIKDYNRKIKPKICLKANCPDRVQAS